MVEHRIDDDSMGQLFKSNEKLVQHFFDVIDKVTESLKPKTPDVPGDAGYDPSVFAKNRLIRDTQVNPAKIRKCSLCGLDQPERTMILDQRNRKYFCSDRKSCWARKDAQDELQEIK